MKKIILKIIYIFAFLIIVSPAFAIDEQVATKEEKTIYSLDDCINYAMEHDIEIKNARERVNVQKSKVGQAKSNYFPTLGITNGYHFGSTSTDANSKTTNAYKLNTSINQMIWDFGRTNAKIDMNKYNLQSAKYDLEYEILLVIYDVKTSYFAVLASKAYADVSQKTVKINKLNYERTKALFEVGLKSKIDVTNAELNYTDAKIQLLEAEHAYDTALIALADAMTYTDAKTFEISPVENFNFKPINYNPKKLDMKNIKNLQSGDNSELVLTSGIEKHDMLKDFNFKPYVITTDEAYNMALSNRPDLKSITLVSKAAMESLKVLKRAYYPSLNASAGYNLGAGSENTTNNFQVYAGLDFPSLNIMGIKTQIDEGKSLYNISLNNIDISKNQIYFEVNNAYITMKQLEKRIPLMAKKVDQALENFELADGRYTVGLGNFIELQDAQTNYNNAQLEFIQIVFKYNVAREEFLKIMGVQ